MFAQVFLSLTMRQGDFRLLVFSDLAQFLLAAAVMAGYLRNSLLSEGQRRVFWGLLALGTSFGAFVQFLWVLYELIWQLQVPDIFWGDIILFLQFVPVLGALVVQPHRQADTRAHVQRKLDFLLVALWWVVVYALLLFPHQYVQPDYQQYGPLFNVLYMLEQGMVLGGLGYLSIASHGGWRTLYRRMFSATVVYLLSSAVVNMALDLPHDSPYYYYSGSLYDLPLILTRFFWVYVAFSAMRLDYAQVEPPAAPESIGRWSAPVAMLAVITVPLYTVFLLMKPSGNVATDRFRLYVACIGMLALSLVMLCKHVLQRQTLLETLERSRLAYDNLQKLQGQMVQTEKLASMGRLVAGAAHEINNPLTAIMGYADLLSSSGQISASERGFANKILEQARRTKGLVSSLLAFAKQAPMQRTQINLNNVVNNALELRGLDMEQKHVLVERDLDPNLPQISGDANHLLQVCFHLFNNATDAMNAAHGGGTLRVVTGLEGGMVVLRCSDTGPGVENLDKIFEPFFTTKEIGKGTGLGLSACYGIVRDHGGAITCQNLPEGGAEFIVALPVLGTARPAKSADQVAGFIN